MSPKSQTDDYAAYLGTSKEMFQRSTRALEEADSGFRPREGTMTAAQQVAHTAQTIEWFLEGATRSEGFDLDFEKHARVLEAVTSLTEARGMLETAFANAIAFFGVRSAEELARPLPAGPVMGGLPVSEIVGAILDHTSHHRGALTVYTRLLGKVPPMPYAD